MLLNNLALSSQKRRIVAIRSGKLPEIRMGGELGAKSPLVPLKKLNIAIIIGVVIRIPQVEARPESVSVHANSITTQRLIYVIPSFFAGAK